MTQVSADDLIFSGEAGREEVLAHGWRLLERQPRAALGQARELLSHDEHDRPALALLAASLRRLGFEDEALATDQKLIAATAYVPELARTALALRERRFRDAEELVRPWLSNNPNDPAALRLLAEVGVRAGARREAQAMLRRALDVAPGYKAARVKLASLLVEESRIDEALEVLDDMLARDPASTALLGSKAAALGRVGEHDQAAALYQQLVERDPGNAALWLSLGHLRNTMGDLEASIAAYRKAAEIKPDAGVVWWSLANLKAFRFEDADVATMEAQLGEELSEDSRLNLHFALGKAYEDRRDAEPAFHHYAAGNAIRHNQEAFDPDQHEALVNRAITVLERVAKQDLASGSGEAGLGRPIFIVGMPRAGSTLIEQILATHSAIEGTAELPILPLLVRELENEMEGQAYPQLVDTLSEERCGELGLRYLEAAQVYRKTDRPWFIDKLPNNWLHMALIQRILPQAVIIDARRHPLDCGWSLFKQNFARGQGFSYDLEVIGRYYRDYVRLMAAADRSLPGRVHRVIHETLVGDSEAQIRALLAHVGVPFEEGVLRFHENDRAVRTPSAAQVRKPINREGMERWRPFEPWLQPLNDALGDVLDRYPEVPAGL
jgi:tetratricopeptide (TPR) repeat protein